MPSSHISSSSDSSEDGRFLPGTLLGERYRIISRLGVGGMGEVYRATDLRLGQAVALKFLPEETARDPRTLARFHNEVRIARQVAHPNVCRVYDIGEVEGYPYLSMEYVDGEDLHSLLRRIGRLPADKAMEISRKLCAGLAAAHDKGVLHRDLKPANIMIDGRGHVLITDFGLAGIMGQVEGAEARNGTPGYMAPEQLRGKEVSAQSDIYALGVVLYEMFTGKPPFSAATRAELIKQAEEGTPTKPRSLVKDIDPAVEDVILRCLAPEPRSRPASALAVSAALPGGDLLAAALAAGETPSPEMVAASGQKIGLKPAIAMGWLAGIILCLGLFLAMNQRVNVLNKIPFENPPEVLTDKSRGILRQLGYSDRAESSASGFEYRFGAISYLCHQFPGQPDARLARGKPSAVVFWYRTSPRPMTPHQYVDIPRISRSDPADNVPGMLHLSISPQGRLVSFFAVPPQMDESKGPWPAPDWNSLLAAAGLDPARLTSTEPQYAPQATSDARAAWTGSYPDAPDVPLRIEAAAYHGKPVNFVQLLPAARQASASPLSGGRSTGDIVYLSLQLIVLIGSIPFARYNLRLGRGDTRGAVRLGLFALCVCIGSWLVGGTHTAGVGEVDLFLAAAMRSLFGAVTLALMYLSFEPFVRRKWPQTIVAWSRVLAGSLRDPLVGRDLLFGTGIGVLLALIQMVEIVLYPMLGISAVRVSTGATSLLGGRYLIGDFLFLIVDTLNKSLGILFLLFMFRTMLRKQWIAAGVVVIVLAAMTATNAANPFIGWGVSLVFFGLMVATLMRFGLVALVAAILVTILVSQFPLTTDVSAWYSGEAAFTVLAVLTLALFGFRTALAGQPLWKHD